MRSVVFVFSLWTTVAVFSHTTIAFEPCKWLQISDFEPFPSIILLPETELAEEDEI